MNFTFQARIIVLEIVGQKTIPVFSLWQYHCTDSKELLLVTVGILDYLHNNVKLRAKFECQG